MNAWWRCFGGGYEPVILIIRDEGRVLGVAPLKCRGGKASFIGDVAVCDYLDFIVVPGQEETFAEKFLEGCVARGITGLELATLRPDAVALRHVLPMARDWGLSVEIRHADVSYEMPLPSGFDFYLAGLPPKLRRDIGRKQRRLGALGRDTFRMLAGDEVGDEDVEVFVGLMAESRRDKACFLTEEMRSYFKDMARVMVSSGFLRLGFLDIGKITVAGVLGFDWNNAFYLYNSGYNPSYTDLGVGLFSKLAAIRWATEQQKDTFDFLKGPEAYKERLGGQAVVLKAGYVTF